MRPILIAECCQNHNGKRDILRRMIDAAVESGADYVKIQAIRSRELTKRARFETGDVDEFGKARVIKRPFEPEYERLKGLDLSLDDEAWFVDACISAGVAPMTTVFTRQSVREVCRMGFEAVKIASYDCASYPLLADIKRHWSTLFVSTGATLNQEVEQAARILQGTHYSFLHCVTIYPTPMNELHLRRMQWLRQFTPHVGFSDHTQPGQTSMWASKIALALGASCVERHFTVLGPQESRDGPVSITPPMLRELRDFADRPRAERMEIVAREYPEWRTSLGHGERSLSDVELLNRDYYAGRFASMVKGEPVYNWEDKNLESEE